MHYAFSKNDDVECAFPFFDRQRRREAIDTLLDALPLGAFTDLPLQVQTIAAGHLDGVKSLVLVERFNYILLEKVTIHAESQRVGVPQALFDLGKHVFEKRDGGAAIIDVAGTVVHAQKMTTVGQVGGYRIVTAYFTMVRNLATTRAADLLARA